LAKNLVSAPVPEMLLAIVMSSDRLSCRVALFTTSPLPSVPAAPTLRMPAEIVVVPE